MIEDLAKHERTIFTNNETLVSQSFGPPFFKDLEEISDAFEIKEGKKKVNITRPYHAMRNFGLRTRKVEKVRDLMRLPG